MTKVARALVCALAALSAGCDGSPAGGDAGRDALDGSPADATSGSASYCAIDPGAGIAFATYVDQTCSAMVAEGCYGSSSECADEWMPEGDGLDPGCEPWLRNWMECMRAHPPDCSPNNSAPSCDLQLTLFAECRSLGVATSKSGAASRYMGDTAIGLSERTPYHWVR